MLAENCNLDRTCELPIGVSENFNKINDINFLELTFIVHKCNNQAHIIRWVLHDCRRYKLLSNKNTFMMSNTRALDRCNIMLLNCYCQNPNSSNNSIELNLRLDYILTARSTTQPPHPTPPHKLSVVVVVSCPASRDLGVQLYKGDGCHPQILVSWYT